MMDINDIPLEIKRKAIGLKRKWSSIYCIRIAGEWFIFRTLTRGEFLFFIDMKQYMLGLDEDFVIDNCVLYPKIENKILDEMLAGTVDSLINSILELSGFASQEALMSLMEENRDSMGLVDNQIISTICRAFPQLDPEKINDFDIQKLTYYLALAEQVLGVTMEFHKETPKQKQQDTNSSIDFTAENRNLRDQGFFGNSDPRNTKPDNRP